MATTNEKGDQPETPKAAEVQENAVPTPPADPSTATQANARKAKSAKEPCNVPDVAQGRHVPCVNGVYGQGLRNFPDGRKGVEPWLTREAAIEGAARLGVSDGVPFQYQFAWVVLSKESTRHIALGRGRQPFRTATDAHHVIRMNPQFGERQFGVLPYADGFAIVPRSLEMTLRNCYPQFVAFVFAEGGERDVATIQANDSGHRMVFARGRKVSAPFGVFQAIRDARGAVVDPVSDAKPGQPGFRVRGTASKYPMQAVLGAVSERDHRSASEAGREERRLQVQRELSKGIAVRPDDTFAMMDGGAEPELTVGL